MEVLHALDIAHQHRRRIDRHIDRAVTLLREPAAIGRFPLSRARWQLVAMLREYHLFKRVEIFEPALRSGSSLQVEQAEQMLNACREGWSLYCAYTLDWSARDVASVWPAYTEAMRGMAVRLHDHIAREEMAVRELLAGSSRTRHLVH